MRRDELISEVSLREASALSDEERESILLDWWGLGPEDTAWSSLPSDLRGEMQSSDEPGEPRDPRYQPLLAVGIARRYRGVKNEYLQRKAQSLGVQVDAIEGEPERLNACPCCRYLSLPDRGEYTICSVCFWEDDGSDEPERYSSPNHMTLRQGRENFSQYGACSARAVALGLVDPEMRDAFAHSDTDLWSTNT